MTDAGLSALAGFLLQPLGALALWLAILNLLDTAHQRDPFAR